MTNYGSCLMCTLEGALYRQELAYSFWGDSLRFFIQCCSFTSVAIRGQLIRTSFACKDERGGGHMQVGERTRYRTICDAWVLSFLGAPRVCSGCEGSNITDTRQCTQTHVGLLPNLRFRTQVVDRSLRLVQHGLLLRPYAKPSNYTH